MATATSLSPASRDNGKEPFSSEHRASGNFLAPSCSHRFLSAYCSFPFTNTQISRVHPISTFFICFLSEVIVVFSQATARFGQETKDRKSTRLNSSHMSISYAVFCLKKKKKTKKKNQHTTSSY